MRMKKTGKGRKAKKASAATPATAVVPPSPPPAPPAAEASPVPRSTRKRTSKKRSVRYTPEQQAEIVQFVLDYNAKNGRAGQSSASKKYGVSVLTISKWLKAPRKPATKTVPGRRGRPTVAAKAARVAEGIEGIEGIEGTLKRMLEIQAKLGTLREEYMTLRGKL